MLGSKEIEIYNMQNIREKEIQLLGKVLTLATSGEGSRESRFRVEIQHNILISGGSTTAVDFSEQWKILIYDHEGRDIISPLLNVGALRQKGVTLHLMVAFSFHISLLVYSYFLSHLSQLHSEREVIPDAPAVYFIKPTEANIKRIAEDCAKPVSCKSFAPHFTFFSTLNSFIVLFI